MAIEISSGGVSKTYQFFPHHAFYIDENGNINVNGNGKQVEEAWFNGVKYYPDGCQWAGVSNGVTKVTNRNCHATYSRYWNWYIGGHDFIIRYERKSDFPTTIKPSSGVWSGVLSYYRIYDSDYAPNVDPHLLVTLEQCIVTADFGDYSWLREYMTSEGQIIFDTLASGLSVTGIQREFDFIPMGNLPIGKYESDMDVNGLYVNATGNIMLYCSGWAGEANQFINRTYSGYSSSIEVRMPMDAGKCDGSEDLSLYGREQYVWFSMHLAGTISPRFDSSGISGLKSDKPVPHSHLAGWESLSEDATYTNLRQ